MKKVSIIVPVWNTEKYLSKCLDSLVNQTLKDIEIIVINDKSPDNSIEIIKKYQEKYKDKIIVINNKENQEISKTRNIGIEKATGEYIAFVDSDDYVDINMYKECYEFATKNNLDILVLNYIKVFEGSDIQEKFLLNPFKISNLRKNKELLFEINPACWNKIFKRSLFSNKNFRFPIMPTYEDIAFIPILLNEAEKIGFLNKFFNYYLIRSNSKTPTMNERVFLIFKSLDNVNNYYKDQMKDELEFFNIQVLLNYTIRQREQKNKTIREKFIDEVFNYLNKKFPNWKNNKYYIKRNILKKILESNKILTKIYCQIYTTIKK